MSEILISVLVPAYKYPEGLDRILSATTDVAGCGEVLVFDDSPDRSVQAVVEKWHGQFRGCIRYRRNAPALGAVANWNALLSEARGQYCWLIHHDECPLDDTVQNVINMLRRGHEVDVLLLNCSLMGPRLSRPHLPMWLRELVVKRFPTYLFRRNVVGPTGCLVIRRDRYPKFAEGLRWLVDVDAYARLFVERPRIQAMRSAVVGSWYQRRDSITAGLQERLRVIEASERQQLMERWGPNVWVSRSESVPAVLLRAAEWGFWSLFRALYSVWIRMERPFTRRAISDHR